MNWSFGSRIGLATLVLAGALATVSAQQPARARGTPIIFSAPKVDGVSSNLNELRTSAAPFRDMEAELKKPFEVFDPNRPDKLFRPEDKKFRPPPPEQNPKHLKEQLHNRAEQMFLNAEPEDDDLFKSLEETYDPYNKKPKTSLDRYYDRMDRNRAVRTNRTSTLDLFGDKKGKDESDQDEFGLPKKKSAGLRDDEQSAVSRNLRMMSNSSLTDENFNAARNKSRSPGDFFGNAEDDYTRNRPKPETRLEEFKRLLDGPGHNTRANFNTPAATHNPTSLRPVSGTTAPTWSSTKPSTKAAPANTFATSAGLVGTPGAPQGLNDFASSTSLNTPPPTPPPAKPVPSPTFSVPKRRF